MITFLHTFHPASIAATFGPFTIHWYGLFITVGAALGIVLAARIARYYEINAEQIYTVSFWAIIFGIVGARLYYVLYAWEFYSGHLVDVVKLWEGGIAIHGAIIGGVLTLYFYAKKHHLNPWLLADITVVGVIVGQIIGRWGNYFNQELFGKPTDFPWGIPIAPEFRPAEFVSFDFFHPTFLYEGLLNLLVLGVLLLWHYGRIKKSPNSRGYGWIAGTYLLCYSAIRFTMEFLRVDYSPELFGIRWAQLLSGVIIVCGLGYITLYHLVLKRRRSQQVQKEMAHTHDGKQ